MAADDSNRPRFNTYGNSTRSQGLQHVPGRLPVEGKSCQYERQAAKVMMTAGERLGESKRSKGPRWSQKSTKQPRHAELARRATGVDEGTNMQPTKEISGLAG